MSCKLISEDISLLILNEENKTRHNIRKKFQAITTLTSFRAHHALLNSPRPLAHFHLQTARVCAGVHFGLRLATLEAYSKSAEAHDLLDKGR
jgi:hypothetical protein